LLLVLIPGSLEYCEHWCLPDGKQHAGVEEASNAMASAETMPARIAAIATVANSCLIEPPDSTPCHLRRAIFRNVSESLEKPAFPHDTPSRHRAPEQLTAFLWDLFPGGAPQNGQGQPRRPQPDPRVHPEIAKALKTRESLLMDELEQTSYKHIIIQSDATLHWEQYNIY
jgi:hypothetical protein